MAMSKDSLNDQPRSRLDFSLSIPQTDAVAAGKEESASSKRPASMTLLNCWYDVLITAPDGSSDLPIEEERHRSLPPLSMPRRVRADHEERIISRLSNARTKEGRFQKNGVRSCGVASWSVREDRSAPIPTAALANGRLVLEVIVFCPSLLAAKITVVDLIATPQHGLPGNLRSQPMPRRQL